MTFYSMEFEIPLISLFFISMVIIVYLFKQKINTLENKVFKAILIASFVEIFFDFLIHLICSINSVDIVMSLPYYNLFNFLNKFIVIAFIAVFECLFIYTLIVTYGKEVLKNKKISYFLTIANVSNLIALMFTKIEIVNAKTAFNVVGSTPTLGYIMIAIYLTLSLIISIKNSKKLDRRYLPIFVILVVLILCYMATVFLPGMILYDFALTVLCYLMFFTIENPDMKLLEELHRSKEISDAANEEKTMFLYNISQEIRNSTGIVDDYANLILETNDKEEINDSARFIKGETSKFNSLMNELFDVSKLDASNIKVYNSKYNVKNIFKEIVTMYNNKCSSKSLDFRVNIDHDIPELLYGDSINLKKVLMIMLDNSLEYTKEGFIEFNVNTIMKNDVCRLIISIDDSGKGIKGEDISNLRINNKSFSEANKLITLMSGAINVSSNYGYGTKVKIILDQKVVLEQNNEVTKYKELYDNIRLLMVDDSEAGIKIIEKTIRGTNIKMEFVMNGKDCISKIKQEHYDLILLDEQLTQISAIELIKKIQGIKNFDTPIILLTKDNSYEYSDEYKKMGFSDYILKPIKKKELLEKVYNIQKKENNV